MLCRTDIAGLLTLEECSAAVERAFHLLGEGRAETPGVMGIPCDGGGFHIKAGKLKLQRDYFAAKVNGNFAGNPSQFGLPTIQGVIVLCDAANGRPLAVMDSIEITARRTAAATALAAKYLARAHSMTITICGCGGQGRAQLRALAAGFRFKKVFAHDLSEECAQRFAVECRNEFGIDVEVVADLGKAVRGSDICVTCTTSRQPLLAEEDVVVLCRGITG